MTEPHKPRAYREMIDALVAVCRGGQGAMGAQRARQGVWNRNASADVEPEQHEFNLLLARLTRADREILARMLIGEVEVGVFETLKSWNGSMLRRLKMVTKAVPSMTSSGASRIGNGRRSDTESA